MSRFPCIPPAHEARAGRIACGLVVLSAAATLAACGPRERGLPPPERTTRTKKALLDGAGDVVPTTANVRQLTTDVEGVRNLARDREAEFDRVRGEALGGGR